MKAVRERPAQKAALLTVPLSHHHRNPKREQGTSGNAMRPAWSPSLTLWVMIFLSRMLSLATVAGKPIGKYVIHPAISVAVDEANVPPML